MRQLRKSKVAPWDLKDNPLPFKRWRLPVTRPSGQKHPGRYTEPAPDNEFRLPSRSTVHGTVHL
jgi:hypothetical protein